MRVPALCLTFVLAPGVSLGAAGKEIEAKSAVASVTVHPDAATVTREATVDLPAGASTLVFRNLPYGLDPASLRVSGEGAARFSIGAVETRLTPADAKTPDSAIAARLKSLRAERDAVQMRLDALSAKLAMILRYAQASPERLAPETRPLPPSEWNAAFETVGAAHAKAGEEMRLARARANELDEEIRTLAAGDGRGARRGPARDVSVSIEAASPGRARLQVSYLTGGAGWTPAYEARLDTGEAGRKPSLDFSRRVLVSQRTGEDWTDVSMSVSTTRAHRAAAAPEVVPRRVAFLDIPMPIPMAKAARGRMTMEGAVAPAAAPPPAEAEDRIADAEPAPQQVATLDAGAYQATYKIGGAVTAPGDGATKSFIVSTRRLEPKLDLRVAPALDPTAYLNARIVNDEDAPLLPGPLAVQRDGVYVGETRLGAIAPGEAADFGFGADDKVKVTRAPVKRSENEPTWYGQTKVELRDYRTTIRNLHGFPVAVTVVDQIPVSENSAIVVEQLPQTTPPTEKQGEKGPGDKRGILGWSFDLQPGAVKELRLAWRVKWPADRDIVTQPAR